MTLPAARAPAPLRPASAGIAPSRRALLQLLGSPILAGAVPGKSETADPHLRLWRGLDAALHRRKQAIARRDRLETVLVRQTGHPRVPLPPARGAPLRYAADAATIDRALGSARRSLRRRLQAQLRRRQRTWTQAARAAGLAQTLADEDAAFTAVEQARRALLYAPASTLPAIRLKLAILIATSTPDRATSQASPWAELHLLLADLHSYEKRQGSRG